ASTERHLSGVLTGIAEHGQWTWVAEDGGELVGMLKLDGPDRAGWVQGHAGPGPMAYLGAMYVAPGQRGNGLGAAMVEHAHATVDAAGIPITGLHYAALNPLSGPFWHRRGYRPLWTQWVRRPAAGVRTPPGDA
ncbi:MAG: GNAT family N-acetyltransferase, partial [Stackebrandtia sp.]